MKNKLLLLAIAVLGASSLKAQLNVGSTSAADASAILQATSTTKGFLPPVMTTTQINAIVLPANGLTVYNSTLSQLQVNVGTPASPSWSVAAGGANVYWSQLGNTGSVPGTNYVGTTDNNSLGFRTNGVERVRIDSATGNVGIGLTTPHAPLQFANTLVNRKIVLTDNGTSAGNDSAFYGFGINASTLRYQVPTGANHTFYSNKTLLANLYSTGGLWLTGTTPYFNFNDQTRPARAGGLYSRDGVVRLWGSQNGDLLTLDSVGNGSVTGKLQVGSIPTSSATQFLTTDGSGNVGQRALKPTIFGSSAQGGVNGIPLTKDSTSPHFTGWTIIIPASSKYIVNVNMTLSQNASYTANSSMFLATTLSTTQSTYNRFDIAGYGVSGSPVLASISVFANNAYQYLSGAFYVNNTTAAPLTLYYLAYSANTNGSPVYTGNITVGQNYPESYIYGTPIY